MDNLLAYPPYLSYLLQHKYHVLKASMDMGVDPIVALAHDNSKFLPSEFSPYSQFFYGNPGQPKVRTPEFERAVKLHKSRNAHHYIQTHRNEDPRRVEMPYRMDSVADWYSVGKTKGNIKTDFKTWWANYKNPPVDKEAMDTIDQKLGLPMGLHKEAATISKADIVMEKQPGNKVGFIAGNKPVKDVQNQPKMVSPSKPQRGPAPIASSHPNHIQAQVEATTTNNDKFTNLTTPEEIKK